MNKVISIEIAKQVFWIEEQGFAVLQTYIEKLKLQLADEECGDEIFVDIELRLAELLFELDVRKDRAVTLVQLTAIIKQIGFIDSAEEEVEEVLGASDEIPSSHPMLPAEIPGLDLEQD